MNSASAAVYDFESLLEILSDGRNLPDTLEYGR